MSIYFFTPIGGGIVWETQKALEWLVKNENKKCWAELGRETGVRTPSQNNALHLGLTMIAKTLNDAGLDMRKVLKPEIEIPWTTASAKDHLWRPIQIAMTGKESTTQLNKVSDITEIWDVIMRFLGEKHGVEYIPFPSENS